MQATALLDNHTKALELLYQGLIRIRVASNRDPVTVYALSDAMHNLPRALLSGNEQRISEEIALTESAIRLFQRESCLHEADSEAVADINKPCVINAAVRRHNKTSDQ